MTCDSIVFHLRELRPRDFYFAQILRQQERTVFELARRLILNEEVFDKATLKQTRAVLDWAIQNLLENNIFTVENWLELAYALCRQRWDQSVDWMEMQPMSKIHTMIEVVKKSVEEQEKAHKKAMRKGK